MMVQAMILASTLACAPLAAAAHSDWDWIQQFGFTDRNGQLCCGMDDCFRVPAAGVESVPGGYAFPNPLDPGRTMTVPYSEAQPSQDGDFWACVNRGRRTLRCFFAPPIGA